ncbi:MAG: tyrosine-type recombinase/integrase [Lachnospiraceae bacterium]|nr:tyrosine-type recombinase/integrase [Lachnospiraceae bacterium]MDD3615517.1 tyrosine-type recombinase/integrase [Lachnospiraceae bacterium]
MKNIQSQITNFVDKKDFAKLIEAGIMTEDEVSAYIMTQIEKIVLQHEKEFRIWQGTGSDKRWKTYLPGEKQIIIAKTSKEKLYKAIYDFYHSKAQPKTNLENIIKDFLDYKELETSIANAHKLESVWNKYFASDLLVKRSMKNIRIIELKEWYLKLIETNGLTKRQFNEIKSLMNMLLDYAVENELVDKNISRHVSAISYKKFKAPKQKNRDEQIFYGDMQKDIMRLAEKKFEETGDTSYLGICLDFVLALRVGELPALKKSDIDGDYIHIQRQEIKHFIKDSTGRRVRDGFAISNNTKSKDSNRRLYLTSIAKKYIRMIVQANEEAGFDSDDLFIDKNGERRHNPIFNTHLNKMCKELGFTTTGNHSIRKTCISNIAASHSISDDSLRKFAGHSDFRTTQRCYIFSTDDDLDEQKALEEALCGLCS